MTQRPGPLRRDLELLRVADGPGRDAAVRPTGLPLVSTQVEYSLVQRGVEREVMGRLRRPRARGAPLVAAGPRGAHRQVPPRHAGRLARGVAALRLVRRSRTSARTAAGSCRRCAPRRRGSGSRPLEVALAWVRDRPGVVAPIVGARTAAQLRGILQAEALALPDEIREALDEVSAPFSGYPDQARWR